MASASWASFDSGLRFATRALVGSLCLLASGAAQADAIAAAQAEASATDGAEHIALLLPTSSSAYGAAATAVREGFMAGYQASRGSDKVPPVFYYPTDGSPAQVLLAYQRAIREGAQLVVGPLTRDSASAVSHNAGISVPTLALNRPDDDKTPPQFYTFGMQSEDEIHQLAGMLWDEGRRRVAILATRSSFFVRMADLFAGEWQDQTGIVVENSHVSTELEELSKIHGSFPPDGTDAIFLSADAHDACLIRPFLGTEIPIYTTSHAYEERGAESRCPDLRGVRFLDMPYALQASQGSSGDQEQASIQHRRFYALGLDAFLLAGSLLHDSPDGAQKLNGATGTISRLGNAFLHKLTPAEFEENGEARPWTSDRPTPADGDQGASARSDPAIVGTLQ